MKSTQWIALGAFAAVGFAGWLVADRIGERVRLRRALAVASAKGTGPLAGSGSGPHGTKPENLAAIAEDAVKPDGATVLTDMLWELPGEVKALLQRFGPRHPRMEPLRKAVLALTPAQLDAVAELNDNAPVFLRQASDDPRDSGGAAAARLRDYVLFAMQSIDPERALGHLTRTDLTDPLLGERGFIVLTSSINRCLQSWALSDPLAAVRWARENAHTLPEGQAHVAVALGVMARNDLPGAWEQMRGAGLEPGLALPGFANAVRSLQDMDFCMKQLQGDTGAAPDDWASALGVPSGSSLQTCVCTDFALRLNGSRGWEEARAFLGEWATTPESLAAAAGSVVMETVTGDASDPGNAAAADWLVVTLPEAHRAAEVTTLVEAWADRDFSAPAAWLRGQPASAWRDSGLAALSAKLAPFDPAAAAEWAGQITDAAIRETTLAQLPAAE